MRILLAFTFVLILLNACKHETNSNATAVSGEMCAEQIESQTYTSRPQDWSEADWNDVVKNLDKEKIFNTIKNDVLDGKLQAYDYVDNSKLFTVDQVKHILDHTDTLLIDNPLNPDSIETKIQHIVIEAKDIDQVRTKEQWYFDENKKELYKKVTDLTFFISYINADSVVLGYKALFSVKLGQQ